MSIWDDHLEELEELTFKHLHPFIKELLANSDDPIAEMHKIAPEDMLFEAQQRAEEELMSNMVDQAELRRDEMKIEKAVAKDEDYYP